MKTVKRIGKTEVSCISSPSVSSCAVTGDTVATPAADCHGDVGTSCSEGVVCKTWKPGSSGEVAKQKRGIWFRGIRSEDDADYAIKILNMIKLYGKPIRVNKILFGIL